MQIMHESNMENSKEQANNYCRTCFNTFEVHQSSEELKTKKHAIFPTLADKLADCTNDNVSENDEYSKFLCDCCYNKLIKFHMFRTMCKASLEMFREMLGKCAENKEKETLPPISLEPFEFSNENKPESVETKAQKLRKPTQATKPLLKKYLNKARKSSRLLNKNTQLRNEKSIIVTGEQKKQIEIPNNSNVETVENSINDTNLETIEKTDQTTTSKTGKLYFCETCPMRFFVEHRLTAHKRAHDGLIPYPCPRENCERGFKRWHCLNEHLKQHEGTNKWFSCEEAGCERRYQHRTTLDMHLRRFHKKGPELKSFVCEICGKVFKSSAILNDHRFTHKDKSELPFACDQPDCKYRFSNREKLKIHLMRHAGIKKFECPHCGMKKTTRNELKIHINYHTHERTFPCRFCTQVCNSAGNLKVHIKTVHERAKDYACRFCERTFAKPDTRKYHEMIHTGEKPNQCTECGKKFVQPAALRTHKKIHQRQQTHQNANQAVKKTESNIKQLTEAVGD